MGRHVRDKKGWYLYGDGLHTAMGLIQINDVNYGHTDQEHCCWYLSSDGYHTDMMVIGYWDTKVGTHTRSGALYRAGLHTRYPITGSNIIVYGQTDQ